MLIIMTIGVEEWGFTPLYAVLALVSIYFLLRQIGLSTPSHRSINQSRWIHTFCHENLAAQNVVVCDGAVVLVLRCLVRRCLHVCDCMLPSLTSLPGIPGSRKYRKRLCYHSSETRLDSSMMARALVESALASSGPSGRLGFLGRKQSSLEGQT